MEKNGDFMVYKIEQDVSGCIGCGACAAVCPKYWAMDGSKAKASKTDFEKADLNCNMDAANSCPVNVIHLIDAKGKKLI